MEIYLSKVDKKAEQGQYPENEEESHLRPYKVSSEKLYEVFRKVIEAAVFSKYVHFLRPNEFVELRGIITKRKMLSTVKMEAILTTDNRTIFLDKECTKKVDDDLEVSKQTRATVTAKGKSIELTDKWGRKRKLHIKDQDEFAQFLQKYQSLASG